MKKCPVCMREVESARMDKLCACLDCLSVGFVAAKDALPDRFYFRGPWYSKAGDIYWKNRPTIRKENGIWIEGYMAIVDDVLDEEILFGPMPTESQWASVREKGVA